MSPVDRTSCAQGIAGQWSCQAISRSRRPESRRSRATQPWSSRKRRSRQAFTGSTVGLLTLTGAFAARPLLRRLPPRRDSSSTMCVGPTRGGRRSRLTSARPFALAPTTEWECGPVDGPGGTFSRSVSSSAHINLLELTAVDISMRWRIRSQVRCGRCLHLLDSQVVLAELSKGRCKSPRLLPGLRKVNARQVVGGLLVTFGFVASEANPADEPSRQP